VLKDALYSGQIIRFGLVGGTGTMVHVTSAYFAYHTLAISGLSANILGFFIALCLTYVGHAYWTFGVDDKHPQRVLRFAISSLACLGFSSAIIELVYSSWGYDYSVALLAIVIAVPPVSFLLARFWTFYAEIKRD
jgi:putative flippase GtrA